MTIKQYFTHLLNPTGILISAIAGYSVFFMTAVASLMMREDGFRPESEILSSILLYGHIISIFIFLISLAIMPHRTAFRSMAVLIIMMVFGFLVSRPFYENAGSCIFGEPGVFISGALFIAYTFLWQRLADKK